MEKQSVEPSAQHLKVMVTEYDVNLAGCPTMKISSISLIANAARYAEAVHSDVPGTPGVA